MFFFKYILIFLNTFSVFVQNLASQTVIKNDQEPSVSSVDTDDRYSYFIPVTDDWQYEKCHKLKLKHYRPCVKEACEKYLGAPKSIQPIPGDGNCFFNALSYWIAGNSKHGKYLRKTIVKSMKTSEKMKSFLNAEVKIDKHVKKMLNYREWADSPEIFAAAEFLKTSIYVFSKNGWNFISRNGVGADELKEPCIYIHHVNDNHFEVITDVHDEDITYIENKINQELEESKNLKDVENTPEHGNNLESQLTLLMKEESGAEFAKNESLQSENTKKNDLDVPTNLKESETQKNPEETEISIDSTEPIKLIETKNYEIEEYISDLDNIEIIEERQVFQRLFMPITLEWQENQIGKVGSTEIKQRSYKETVKDLGEPIECEEIARHGLIGLCSALSYCIAGTTKYRKKIQEQIINTMKSSSTYKSLTAPEKTSKKRIKKIENDVNASVDYPELLAAAEYMETSIYVYYTYGWEFYSKNGIDGQEIAEPCIYLKKDEVENYFDVVTDVENIIAKNT